MERMKKIVLILFFSFSTCSGLFAQTQNVQLADSIFTAPAKRAGAAIIENLGINVTINRFDANIRNIYWAKVTPATWKTNLSKGFETDYDHFTTNWLGHPAHGSLFYNAARSNGYNFWQSIPFTAGGSLVWEYFGETYSASKIDLLTTSFGGIYLGEITNRFTSFFRQKIKNRFLQKTAVSIINPVGQINSLFFKPSVNAAGILPIPLIKGQLATGASFPFGKIKGSTWGPRCYISLSLLHGDLFKQSEKIYKPFDFFILKTWLNFASKGRDSIFFNVSSHAAILAKHLNKNSVLSLSQHYDYLASDVYKIGSLAITGDYTLRYYWHPDTYIAGAARAGVILFGSSKSDIVNFIYHSTDPEFLRDYVYGNGFAGEAEFLFKTKRFGKLIGNINRWIIYTDSDTKGKEDLVLLIFDYDYPLGRKFNIGLQANYYKRLAHYNDYPAFRHIKNDYYEFKALINLQF